VFDTEDGGSSLDSSFVWYNSLLLGMASGYGDESSISTTNNSRTLCAVLTKATAYECEHEIVVVSVRAVPFEVLRRSLGSLTAFELETL
jgi:hypothetical protein